jgi:hypothetical protein
VLHVHAAAAASGHQLDCLGVQCVQAELAERCSLLELKARMLEHSVGQPQYAEEGLAVEDDNFQYADDVLRPSYSMSDDSLQHEDDTPNLEGLQH